MTASSFDFDVYRSAHAWMKLHGDFAAVKARERAAELAAAIDVEGAAAWLRIVAAILDLQKSREGPLS